MAETEAPLTGVRHALDVLRHLVTHGPARNDAERAELLAAIDKSDTEAAPAAAQTEGSNPA